ncbi:C2 domain-containing protein [Pelagophyceae sp. CCMP2097]|nr:C2 domain-containing protein [Pelagophyceae sp. CCMP2097]
MTTSSDWNAAQGRMQGDQAGRLKMRRERDSAATKANARGQHPAAQHQISQDRVSRRVSRRREGKKERKGAKASVLEVHVVAAKDLPKMDLLIGKCDAYVAVKCAGKSKRTKAVAMTYCPTFNHKFRFTVPPLSDALTFEAWDADLVGADDFIGAAQVPLMQATTQAGELVVSELVNAAAKPYKKPPLLKYKIRWVDDDEADAPRRSHSDVAHSSKHGGAGRSPGHRSLDERPAADPPLWTCWNCGYDANGAADECDACEKDRDFRPRPSMYRQLFGGSKAPDAEIEAPAPPQDKPDDRTSDKNHVEQPTRTASEKAAAEDDVLSAFYEEAGANEANERARPRGVEREAGRPARPRPAGGWRARVRRASRNVVSGSVAKAGEIKDLLWKEGI